MDLRPFIRDVPDFPKPGIVFKDITPLLRSHEALDYISHALAEPFKDAGVTAVAAIESRGFIFGSGVARVRPAAASTPLNTAAAYSRSTTTHSRPMTAFSSSTTCWPPAVRQHARLPSHVRAEPLSSPPVS